MTLEKIDQVVDLLGRPARGRQRCQLSSDRQRGFERFAVRVFNRKLFEPIETAEVSPVAQFAIEFRNRSMKFSGVQRCAFGKGFGETRGDGPQPPAVY